MKIAFVRILLLVVATILTAGRGYCQSAPTNGLVGYYTFDSSANDTTGISQNGILNGGGISYTKNRFGSNNAAVHFAGGGYVSITPTPVDVNADYSITFWCRLDAANNTPYNLLSTAEDIQGGMNFRLYPGSFGWSFIAQGDDTPTSLTPANYAAWHGIVCVHQGTNDYMYIDNVLETSGGHAAAVVDNGSLWLGRHQNPGGFNYDLVGAMDDVRFYNRALSASEVSQLYVYEAPPPPPPPQLLLVGYYKFDGDVNDSTTNQNNGAINGSGITFTSDRFGSNNAAVHFAGGGYVSITPTPVNVNSDYTISCWVKLDDSSTTPYNIFSTAEDNLGGVNLRTYANMFGWAYIAQGSEGVNSAVPTNFTDWHSTICVHQGTNDLFYIDGMLRNSGSHTVAATDDGSLWLGRHESSFFYDLHGALDDVRLYNYALTNTEVAQLYSNDIVGFTQLAQATASLTNGTLSGATMIEWGSGYTNTPLVRIIGGGGTGAVASAVVSNGLVVAIDVSDPGSGYTNTPLVVIEPPVIPSPVLTISSLSLLTFSNLLIGTNYQLQLLSNGSLINEPLNFSATNSVYSEYFPGYVDPAAYRLTVQPASFSALATAQTVNGFFVGATITSPGFGYTADAAVTVSGGGGSNGVAIAQVGGGVVTNIHVIAAGSGYTSLPTLTIAQPPPGPFVSPTVQQVIRIASSRLSPYDNYQIQFMQHPGAVWMDYPGGLITATDVTDSQDVFVTNSGGFFRMRYAGIPQ